MTDDQIEGIRDRLTAECKLGTFDHSQRLVGENLFVAPQPSRVGLLIKWPDPYDPDDLTAAVGEAIRLLKHGGGDVVIQWSGSRLRAAHEEIESPFSPP